MELSKVQQIMETQNIQVIESILTERGISTADCSPLPWTLKMGYEQTDPGYYIVDKDGMVILAEDVELTEEDKNVIVEIVAIFSQMIMG